MRQALHLPVPPLERLAQRICKAANARGTKDASAIISLFKQRSKITVVNAAVELAAAKQWLRFDGSTYTGCKPALIWGVSSRRGPRTRRVTPF